MLNCVQNIREYDFVECRKFLWVRKNAFSKSFAVYLSFFIEHEARKMVYDIIDAIEIVVGYVMCNGIRIDNRSSFAFEDISDCAFSCTGLAGKSYDIRHFCHFLFMSCSKFDNVKTCRSDKAVIYCKRNSAFFGRVNINFLFI